MEDRSKEDVERGVGAILAINSFLSSMRQYYKELEEEVDIAESSFDTGLLTGYRHALEMMEDRARIYGVFQMTAIEYPSTMEKKHAGICPWRGWTSGETAPALLSRRRATA